MKIVKLFKGLLSDNSGATAVEYGLIASLIVVAIIISVKSVADQNTGLWDTVKNTVTGAASAGSP